MEVVTLKPLGYFYDVHSCPFPLNKSPVDVILLLRDKFGLRGSEVDFVVVCDFSKVKKELVDKLNYIPLLTIVDSSSETEEKTLATKLRQFASDYQGDSGTIVLITNDEDLRTQIADLRYKKRHQVILLHGSNVTVDFPKFANEHYNWDKFLEEVPNVHQAEIKYQQQLQVPPIVATVLLLPLPPDVHKRNFSKRHCEERLAQLFPCRKVMFYPDKMMGTLMFNDITDVYKVNPNLRYEAFGHTLKLIFSECKGWRENGECPVGIDSCPFVHFLQSKFAGPQLSSEELVKLHSTKEAGSAANRSDKGKQSECKYFRGSGCNKGESCPFRHNQSHKGADVRLFAGRQHNGKFRFPQMLKALESGTVLRAESKDDTEPIARSEKISNLSKSPPISLSSSLSSLSGSELIKVRRCVAAFNPIRLCSTAHQDIKSKNNNNNNDDEPKKILLMSKSLYVGVLSGAASEEKLTAMGKRLNGFVDLALKIHPNLRYAFFNFISSECAKIGIEKLEEMKKKMLEAENTSVFETFTNVQFAETKTFKRGVVDTYNPAKSKGLYVGCLQPTITQADLSHIGNTKLSDCGFKQAVLKTGNNCDINYGFLLFETAEGAEKAKVKLSQMKYAEMKQQPKQKLFTPSSSIKFKLSGCEW